MNTVLSGPTHIVILIAAVIGIAIPVLIGVWQTKRSARRAELVPTVEENNTLALVTIILAFIFFPAAIIIGHFALANIYRTGQRGWGVAITGLWIAYTPLITLTYFLIGLLVVRLAS